jgi:hypothetical protein
LISTAYNPNKIVHLHLVQQHEIPSQAFPYIDRVRYVREEVQAYPKHIFPCRSIDYIIRHLGDQDLFDLLDKLAIYETMALKMFQSRNICVVGDNRRL